MIRKLYRLVKSWKNKYPLNPNVIYKDLLKSQFYDYQMIVKDQLIQLNKLIKIANNSSEFYHRLYKGTKFPVEKISELGMLPVISKDDIKKEAEKFKTKNYTTNFKHVTSGSTGDPIVAYISGMAEAYRIAGRQRFMSWWGLKPEDKSVLIWGQKATKERSYECIEILRSKLHNRIDINVFDLNENTIEDYFKIVEKFRPLYIRGYKSGIYQLAELLKSNNLKFNNSNLKIAIVTSEVLYKEERIFIEEVLKCKVVNEYGAADAGLFAFECPSGSMHIFEEAVLIDTDPDGFSISTELYNDSMPLINYRIDDHITISKEKCECGRNLRKISEIKGRLSDFIIKPDGSKMSQYIFYYIIKEIEDMGFQNAIKNYKVEQSQNSFEIYIVMGNGYSEKIEDYIIRRMKNEIGDNISINFRYIEKIEREPGGKLRFFKRID